MLRRIRLYRGDRGSNGGRDLANFTRIKRILRGTATGFRSRGPSDFILNWGYGGDKPEALNDATWINEPEAVRLAIDKLRCFEALQGAGVAIPEFTTERSTAQEWVDAGDIAVVRSVLRGSGGAGISLVEPAEAGQESPTVGQAPLYTKYFKGFDEFRIHVVGDSVIDTQQKLKRRGVENVNEIRNTENGWVFCREGVEAPEAVNAASKAAVQALGLHFGAVDVKFNRHYGTCAVLEVNTGPGLEGTTLRKYGERFSRSNILSATRPPVQRVNTGASGVQPEGRGHVWAANNRTLPERRSDRTENSVDSETRRAYS